MSFASTGKTDLFLLILVGRIFPFYVELFFRFLFLLLGGICLFAIVVLSVCPSTSVNRVYSFCHRNDFIDVCFSIVLDLSILSQSGMHACKELLYESVVTNSVIR